MQNTVFEIWVGLYENQKLAEALSQFCPNKKLLKWFVKSCTMYTHMYCTYNECLEMLTLSYMASGSQAREKS